MYFPYILLKASCNQLKCSSKDEQKMKTWYMLKVEFCLTIKKSKIIKYTGESRSRWI